mgnify:CR=1 FL=1
MNKSIYTKVFLKQLGKVVTEVTVKEHMYLWWQNNRSKDSGGLRLTQEGLDLISQLDIAIYEIPFPKDMRLTAQTIIFLDQFIDCPYFLTNDYVIVTNEKKAVELTLFSGDVRKYGLTKAMNSSKHKK